MNILSHQGKIGPRGLVGFTGVKGPPVSKTSFKAGDVDMEIKRQSSKELFMLSGSSRTNGLQGSSWTTGGGTLTCMLFRLMFKEMLFAKRLWFYSGRAWSSWSSGVSWCAGPSGTTCQTFDRKLSFRKTSS